MRSPSSLYILSLFWGESGTGFLGRGFGAGGNACGDVDLWVVLGVGDGCYGGGVEGIGIGRWRGSPAAKPAGYEYEASLRKLGILVWEGEAVPLPQSTQTGFAPCRLRV